jgi:hypothetical protein
LQERSQSKDYASVNSAVQIFCLLHIKYQKSRYIDKKEEKFFLIYKEIQSGAVAKPYEEGLPNI